MPSGIALTIGLNSVDPAHYDGWSGKLAACEADAEDMAGVAVSRGFEVTTLMTKDATRDRVLDEVFGAAGILEPGDIFMLSYSGHGGQLPDYNTDEEEIDLLDETWCLYDAQVVDDEIYAALAKFEPGVRVLVFSDSCHSGTVVKVAYYYSRGMSSSPGMGVQAAQYRSMSSDTAQRVYRKNREFYDAILKDPKLEEAREAVRASAILISGCQDNQLASDGRANGLFTSQLLTVWNDGAFKGGYRKFHRQIVRRMPPDQTPNYFRVGRRDSSFERQTPFTI